MQKATVSRGEDHDEDRLAKPEQQSERNHSKFTRRSDQQSCAGKGSSATHVSQDSGFDGPSS
jgi:hypothetical protein